MDINLSNGLADIPDAEYSARYDRIVMALQALVNSSRAQSGESRDLELQRKRPGRSGTNGAREGQMVLIALATITLGPTCTPIAGLTVLRSIVALGRMALIRLARLSELIRCGSVLNYYFLGIAGLFHQVNQFFYAKIISICIKQVTTHDFVTWVAQCAK